VLVSCFVKYLVFEISNYKQRVFEKVFKGILFVSICYNTGSVVLASGAELLSFGDLSASKCFD